MPIKEKGLATRLVPVALLLQILFLYQQDYIYKRLPALANHAIVLVYACICIYAFAYFVLYFEDIAIWRQGSVPIRGSPPCRSARRWRRS